MSLIIRCPNEHSEKAHGVVVLTRWTRGWKCPICGWVKGKMAIQELENKLPPNNGWNKLKGIDYPKA